MRFADAVEFALASLRKRRLRTFLTASGVMIGIGALVSMISFGKGMQKNVTEAFKASDLFNTLMVMPGGAEAPSGDPDRRTAPGQGAGRPDAVLDDAAVAAISRIPGVRTAYPDISFPAMVGFEGAEEFRLVQVVPAAVAASKRREGQVGTGLRLGRRGGRRRQPVLVRRLGTDGSRVGRGQDDPDHLRLDRPRPARDARPRRASLRRRIPRDPGDL